MQRTSKVFGLICCGCFLGLFTLARFAARGAEENAGNDSSIPEVTSTLQETYQDYVTGQLNREEAEKTVARQRQEQVRLARESWRQTAKRNRSGNRSRALAEQTAVTDVPEADTATLDPVEEREINNAALLSVYDADNSGELNEREKEQVLEDSQVDSIDMAAVSRWQILKQKIEDNTELGEAEKVQLLEQIQVKIDSLSTQGRNM